MSPDFNNQYYQASVNKSVHLVGFKGEGQCKEELCGQKEQ